jgi:hypothetical protein
MAGLHCLSKFLGEGESVSVRPQALAGRHLSIRLQQGHVAAIPASHFPSVCGRARSLAGFLRHNHHAGILSETPG